MSARLGVLVNTKDLLMTTFATNNENYYHLDYFGA